MVFFKKNLFYCRLTCLKGFTQLWANGEVYSNPRESWPFTLFPGVLRSKVFKILTSMVAFPLCGSAAAAQICPAAVYTSHKTHTLGFKLLLQLELDFGAQPP